MDWKRYQSTLPEGERGPWKIERYEVTEEGAKFHNLRCAFQPGMVGRSIPAGTYTKLTRNGTLVMSDTPAEIRDHYMLYHKAHGHVLINGLGMGVALSMILGKPEVGHVTVVEIDADVIALVGPHFLRKNPNRLTIVQGDAFTWQPPKGQRYGAVWHDIWDTVCTDNLSEMAMLHRRYGRRADWQGSWCKEDCRFLRDQRGW